ncbi:MAG: FACT complex subunit spt16 [Alyxoria varia]|nr:MAG: FACT complex subunit spt16 [Alyxoria varia]
MAEDAITISKSIFHRRASSLITQWKSDRRSGDALFAGATSFSLVLGKSDESTSFQMHASLQSSLLGYEFPATLMLFTVDSIHVVTTKKKAQYLEPLRGGAVPIEIYVRGKDADENAKQFEKCSDIIKKAGPKHGIISKVDPIGPFVDEWKKCLDALSGDIEQVDISPGVSQALAIKDETELRLVREAARASSGLTHKWTYEELSEIIDEDKRITNKEFAEQINNKIDDVKAFEFMRKISPNFDPNQLDWALQPIVQSGGKYDLKLKAESDSSELHQGTVLIAYGFRYQNYCAHVARTYMVEPNSSQQAVYKTLFMVYESVLKTIKDGVTAKSVYEKALGVLKAKKPELEKHFTKTVGYAIGLEARDSLMTLNATNNRVIKDGMTLAVSVGFADVKNPHSQDKKDSSYSLLIADTIRVQKDGNAVFTKDASADLNGVSFFFQDNQEEKEEKTKPKKDAPSTRPGTQTRTRGERATNQDAEKEKARQEHQKALHQKKQQEGIERFSQKTGALNGVEEKKFKRFESYKRDNQFPSRTKDLVICVDERAQTIILPVMGRPVPFHINTVKNASKNDEGGYTFLRLNFLSPGQGVGKKDDQPFEDPNAHFVRSLTFRSKDTDRIEGITKQITDLKKSAVRREQEKKEMEDVVEQDKLVEMRNRRPHRMEPVFIRPGLEGKRLAGGIEIHQNGLRYVHQTGQKVDILFSNVKHLFFQPCDQELIVIIHVHLISPMMIGKKKTKDVQFCREATENAFDETGNRKRKHRYGDEEEFEAEQQERRRRAQLNKEFKQYTERIADAGRSEGLNVDIPFRELGFNGVPSRSSVLVQPSTDCLIQLTEPPFLVITLAEIEIVHLERVQFGLKNFDMVVVLRDFQKPPIHINTIPVEMLDGVKDWLDSVDIPFSEGPLNLNWGAIMKTVTSDPHAFFEDGGWSFLAADSDDESGDGDDESESDFEMSDDEIGAMSQESSEADSEIDENASDDASEGGGSAESEDEGEDWDELERKAKKKDRDTALDKDDDEGSKPKGKPNGKPMKRR